MRIRKKRQLSTFVYFETLQLPMFYILLDGELGFHVNPISYWESIPLCLPSHELNAEAHWREGWETMRCLFRCIPGTTSISTIQKPLSWARALQSPLLFHLFCVFARPGLSRAWRPTAGTENCVEARPFACLWSLDPAHNLIHPPART